MRCLRGQLRPTAWNCGTGVSPVGSRAGRLCHTLVAAEGRAEPQADAPRTNAQQANAPRTKVMRRGATIIEVVMAIVILSIALPPLVSAFADASMQSIHPSQATVAAFLAIDRMEQIAARRYGGKQGAESGYDGVKAASFQNEVPVVGFPMFERRVTITNVDSDLNPSPSNDYKKVRVTVSWNDGGDQVVIEHVFARLAGE
ncbi:MAG: hypothetical protein JXQ75_16030 [Phycisphaerae bacterium]|nr:hypothetical protein [Phycisphaerae bacterium]